MSFDITSLIAKKSYFVPITAQQLLNLVEKHLNSHGDVWYVESKSSGSATFHKDWEEHYASIMLLQDGKPFTKDNLAKKKNEFRKDSFGNIAKVLKYTQSHIPMSLRYIVTEKKSDGCVIEATSRPAAYELIVRNEKCDDLSAEHLRLSCEEFLDDIFIGSLGGKPIVGTVSFPSWILLVNDTHTREITEKINKMLTEASSRVLSMGCWIGTDCIPRLKKLKEAGVPIRMITHNPNERKGPVSPEIQKGYAELIKIIDATNISNNPVFHGRVLIVDNKALIGSMDLNAYSLSGEHVEFAIFTDDIETVRSLSRYFEKNFNPLKTSANSKS